MKILAVDAPAWWVYVLRSEMHNVYYAGSSTDPRRRLRQHNGEITGGGRYTSTRRPWIPCILYGPYKNRSTAFKAEIALKRSKRGVNRTRWTLEQSEHCIPFTGEDSFGFPV